MRSGLHREDSRDRHQHVVSSSDSSSGRWARLDQVVGSCGLVGDSVPSPAGMDRRMGRCRTGRVEVSTG